MSKHKGQSYGSHAIPENPWNQPNPYKALEKKEKKVGLLSTGHGKSIIQEAIKKKAEAYATSAPDDGVVVIGTPTGGKSAYAALKADMSSGGPNIQNIPSKIKHPPQFHLDVDGFLKSGKSMGQSASDLADAMLGLGTSFKLDSLGNVTNTLHVKKAKTKKVAGPFKKPDTMGVNYASFVECPTCGNTMETLDTADADVHFPGYLLKKVSPTDFWKTGLYQFVASWAEASGFFHHCTHCGLGFSADQGEITPSVYNVVALAPSMSEAELWAGLENTSIEKPYLPIDAVHIADALQLIAMTEGEKNYSNTLQHGADLIRVLLSDHERMSKLLRDMDPKGHYPSIPDPF